MGLQERVVIVASCTARSFGAQLVKTGSPAIQFRAPGQISPPQFDGGGGGALQVVVVSQPNVPGGFTPW